VAAMRRLLKKKWNNNGQSLIEYAMVAAVISAAMIAMSTYVFRAVQGTQQKILDVSGK
jgi:Flp pilus assembly pilin Flp